MVQEMDAGSSIKFSDRWVIKFMRRYGFTCREIHGEAGDVHLEGGDEDITEQVEEIKDILKDYPLNRIYNLDEAGLFFSQTPTRTISSEAVSGVKEDKSRITTSLATNAQATIILHLRTRKALMLHE